MNNKKIYILFLLVIWFIIAWYFIMNNQKNNVEEGITPILEEQNINKYEWIDAPDF